MWDRIERSRDDSDVTLFHDLMLLGELVTKITVLALVSGLADDRERQRYSIEFDLARANSLGVWTKALEDTLSGPASSLFPTEATDEKRELMQKWGPDEEIWQRRAVDLLVEVSRSVETRADPLPSRLPLMRWFQDFAWLRNRTKGHGATTAAACSLMVPSLEQSLRIVTENLSAIRGPWLYLHRNLSGKFRVMTLSGNCKAFDYLKSEQEHGFGDGVYRAFGPSLVPIPFLYTDVDLSDFYVANGGFSPTDFEALSYVSDDVKKVSSGPYLISPAALPRSGTSAGPELDLLGMTFANLPTRVADYVRRNDLEEQLRDLLLDNRREIITLVGRGGAGKTSLALEVLYGIAETQRYSAIVWFSARDIDLLPRGPRKVEADVLTEKEIADQFVTLMNPSGSASREFDVRDYLFRFMGGQDDFGPILFVFDNFETFRNAGDVFNTLDKHVRLPNKVLITSRSREFRGDYPVEVKGMTREQFDTLATTTAARLGIGNLLNNRFLDELFDESDGHPYVVKVLLGEMQLTGRTGSVERIISRREDILDALFERTYSKLSPASQRVFLTLCNWRSVVPRLALEAALTRPENERMDVSKAVDELENCSLIEVIGGSSVSDQFLRVPLAASIFGEGKLQVNSARTAIEVDTGYLRMFGAARIGGVEKGLSPRVDRLVASMSNQMERGQDVTQEIGILEFVARDFPPAWLKLAELYEEGSGKVGEKNRAKESMEHYLQKVPNDRDAWWRLAQICQRQNDGLGELQALLQRSQLLDTSVYDLSHVANRFNSLISARSVDLVGDEKRMMAERIRVLLEQRLTEADATVLSRLAWLCLHLGDDTAALQYARRGLVLEPQNSHCQKLVERIQA